MNIKRLFGIEGTKKANGTVVIVDIFRAATVAVFLLAKGVKYIIPVKSKEEAMKYKKGNEYILVGEEDGLKIEDFDYGNSPSEIVLSDVRGKIAIHRTTQGTQGIKNAKNAQEIIFASLPSFFSIVKYLRKKNITSIVAMDGFGSEDDIFADLLIRGIKNENIDIEKEIKKLMSHPSAMKFLDKNNKSFPMRDLKLCLKVGIFDFFPKSLIKEGELILVKSSV